jgi:hypothetical protein
MAFARQYDLSEVKGMLAIYNGNQLKTATGTTPAAHASGHVGSDFRDMRTRVNTPGQTRVDGTYITEDAQAKATQYMLNSPAGQLALQTLDAGQASAVITIPLPANTYKMAAVHDRSNVGPGLAGHVGKNNAARGGAGADTVNSFAASGFMKVYKAVGGLLQIQTSYPIA